MTVRQVEIAEAFAKLRIPCAEPPLQQEIVDLITPKISKERSACDQNNHKLITPNVDKVVTPKPRHEKDALHEQDDKRGSEIMTIRKMMTANNTVECKSP